jgi:hypothetical protein
MRFPTLTVLALSILVGSCGSTPAPAENGGKKATAAVERPEPSRPGASVDKVKGRPIRLEWRNLKAANGDLRMGLMNRSSPDQVMRYRKPKDFKDVKAVDDQVMANLLATLDDSEFYDLAATDVSANDFKMGDGYGVVWLQIGDRNWTLMFKPMGTAARRSPLPRTYRDIKLLIMNVYNQTLDFAPSTSGSRESFRIEPHKYEKKR